MNTARTVKPDNLTKYVAGGAYLIIVALMFWIGSSVVGLREDMVGVKKDVSELLRRVGDLEREK